MTSSVSLGPNPTVSNCFYLSPIVSGHLHDLDGAISSLQSLVLSSPRSDPAHALYLQRLAVARSHRYGSSENLDDLDESVLCFTEAIFLPLTLVLRPPDLNIVQIFYRLTSDLLRQAQ